MRTKLLSLILIFLLFVPLISVGFVFDALPIAEALDTQKTTVKTGTALTTNTKQGTFYTNDTFWVYIRDTTGLTHNLYCKNRTATTWTGVWSLALGSTSSAFALVYNDTHLSYVRNVVSIIYFRMGTLSGCSISWIAAEDVVITEAAGITAGVQYLEQDASGYWWALYSLHNPATSQQSLRAIKNSEVNGTWGIADVETLEAYKAGGGFGGVLLADSTTVTAIYRDDALDKIKAKVYTAGNSSFGTAYTLTGTVHNIYTGIVRSNYLKVAWIGLTGTYPNWHWYINVSSFLVGTGWTNTDLVYDWTGSLPSINPVIQWENSTKDILYWQNKPDAKDINYKEYNGVWLPSIIELTNDTSSVLGISAEGINHYTSKWLCYTAFATPTYYVKCYIDNVTIPITPPATNDTDTEIPDLDFDPYMFTEKKFYTIQQTAYMSTGSIDVMQVRFNDSYNTFVLYYDNSTSSFGTNATDYIILDKYHSTATEYTSANNFTIVAEYIIKLTEKVVDARNVDLYSFVNNSVGSSGWILNQADYFDIYNLGGHIEWDSSGNAGRIQGGDTFEMYAYNNSWVAVNQTWYHWVQYHAQFSLKIHDNNSAADGINSQYWQDDTHYSGLDLRYADKGDWQIKATVYAFDAINKTYVIQSQCWLQMEYGDMGTQDRWTVFNATWLDRNSNLIKSDLFTLFIENDPKSEIRLYLDLWFNQVNASTINGGRLTAHYYGMHKNAYLWWGDWVVLGGSSDPGSHTLTNNTISSAFMTNYDANGKIAPAQNLELVKIGFNLSRPHTATIPPGITPDWAIRLQDFVISEFKTVPDEMVRGINTPVRIDTLIPNLPSTGFWTPLYDAISKVGEFITTSLAAAAGFIWAAIGDRWPWFTNFWDNVLLTISTLFDYIYEIWGYFISFIGTLTYLISPIRAIIDVFANAFGFAETMFSWISGPDLISLITILFLILYFVPLMYAFFMGDIQTIKDFVVTPLRVAFGALMWAYGMIRDMINWALEAIPF